MAPKNRNGRPLEEDDDDAAGALDENAITDIVNKAVTKQLGRRLPGMIEQAVSKPLGEIRDLLNNGGGGGRGQRRQADDDVEDDADDAGTADQRRKGARPAASRGSRARVEDDDEAPRQPDPEVARLRKELDKLTQQQQTQLQQTRDRERDVDIREQLAAAGVEKNRMRGAVAVVASQSRWDDKANKWVMTVSRDGADEDVDLATGITDWVSGDEGKAYVAAPQSAHPYAGGGAAARLRSGAGTRVQPGATGARSAPQPGSKEAKAARQADARNGLRAGIDQVSAGIGVGDEG